MKPLDFTIMGRRVIEVYNSFFAGIREKYGINQSCVDVVMFFANHPQNNTARDLCEMRGMKTGIVSISIETLIKSGFLRRENDPKDRRLARLYLTTLAEPLSEEGHATQGRFGKVFLAGITDDELDTFWTVSEKAHDNLMNYLNGDKKDV